MLTANDVQNIKFTNSRGKYKASEVDEFLDRCAETISALTSARNELEKKLEVLADKLVEYRNDEDNIRTALLSAQKLGDTVVREARHKAGLILDDARIKAEKIQENAQKSIREEERELERIQREITNFKARMLSIYREHLSLIDVLPEVKEEEVGKEDTQPEQTEESAAEAEVSLVTSESEAAFEPVEEPAAATAPAAVPEVVLDLPELQDDQDENENQNNNLSDTVEIKPVSRFGDLKFGDDYDISKDNGEHPTSIFRHRK